MKLFQQNLNMVYKGDITQVLLNLLRLIGHTGAKFEIRGL